MNDLNIQRIGRGPDIVLIHGWGMNSAIWGELIPKLQDGATLHCVDLPGHGQSRFNGQFELDSIVATIAEAVPNGAMWLGWSLGGLIALAAALKIPNRVSKLGLVSSTPCFVQRDDWSLGVDSSVYEQFGADLAANYTKTLKTFIALQTLKTSVSGATRRQLQANMCAGGEPNPVALQGGLQVLCETDMRQTISGVQQPSLILQGQRDALVNPDAARYMAEQLPNSRLEMFETAGHALMVSDAERCAETILDFMNE